METDPDLFSAIDRELTRQRDGIELIASENIVSQAVLEAQGTSYLLTTSIISSNKISSWLAIEFT